MLKIFLFGILCGIPTFGQIVNNIVIPQGGYHIFSNPGYPDNLGYKDITVEWNFEVEEGGKIKVECDDLRMMQRDPWTQDCPHVYLSAIDGDEEKKICGDGIYNFVHKSNGRRLKIKIGSSTKGSGLFKCVAKNLGDPIPTEVISLHPNGMTKKIKIIGSDNTSYLDKLWIFDSPKGVRMSFQCYVILRKKEPMCGITSFIFNDGLTDQEFCERNDYIFFSKTNKAKLRILLDNSGEGHVECIVQAVTGPHPNEYENAISKEVDSSEHGVIPGIRKTSCKCGWANKNSARIINGKETRVNEFPWMVYLNIIKQVGSWISSCGASIITARHVLTAAHCVVTGKTVVKPENLEMILAQHNVDKPTGKEITISAERVFVRDMYLQKGLAYEDFAIIFTKETIDFSTPQVGPICIEPKEYSLINRRINIMGWGLTENFEPSSFLRKSKARVIDNAICGGMPWDVCTMTSPSSPCNGDSGGPLVWLDPETNRYAQISLVSRGGNNRCQGKQAISTLVAYFHDWIQQIIKETDPSVSTCHKI